VDIPLTPEQITAEWVGNALAIAGFCDFGDVVAVRPDANSVDVPSIVGDVLRLQVEYKRKISGSPLTLIAKLPTRADSIREAVAASGDYKVESDIYALFGAESDLPVPRCYRADGSPDTGLYSFLLEDISPAHAFSQTDACDIESAEKMVEAIADIHCRFWGRDDLPRATPGAPAELIQRLESAGWPTFIERYGDQLNKTLSSYRFVLDNRELVTTYTAGGPTTIAHADLHLENILFTEDPRRPVVIVDWQLSRPGLGAQGLSYFLVSSLEPELRRAHEDRLVRLYHRKLVEAGIQDYDFDRLWLDYRATAVRLLPRPITMAGGMGGAYIRPDHGALIDTMFQRTNAAILDLDPVDALREAAGLTSRPD
jgi:hypothetical protein